MASKFLRRRNWWTKFRHPSTGQLIRESLETADEARAELLRQRLDLEVALRDPWFLVAEVPARIREALGGFALANVPEGLPLPPPQPARMPTPPMQATRNTMDEAVAAYLRFIKSENAPPHVANKVSIFRRFIGAERLERVGGPVKTKCCRLDNGNAVPDPPPFFTGTYLDEVTPVLVQNFLKGLGVGKRRCGTIREAIQYRTLDRKLWA